LYEGKIIFENEINVLTLVYHSHSSLKNLGNTEAKLAQCWDPQYWDPEKTDKNLDSRKSRRRRKRKMREGLGRGKERAED
jgi:hypothetical protein